VLYKTTNTTKTTQPTQPTQPKHKMVKNLKGGKGHKSMARKSVASGHSCHVRIPENEPLELFAVVTKFYGNQCDVLTNTNLELKCHIRGKFRGKSKRNAYIVVGKIILVGLRDFETTPKNCDLLHVYEPTAYSTLNSLTAYNLSNILNISSSLSSLGGTDRGGSSSMDDLFFGEGDVDAPKTVTEKSTAPIMDKIPEENEETENVVIDDDFINDI